LNCPDYPGQFFIADGFLTRIVFLKLKAVMLATSTTYLRLIFLFALFQTSYFSFSQNSSFPIKEVVKKLADKNGPAASGIQEVLAFAKDKDSAAGIQIFNELQRRGNGRNNYFKARFYAAKMMSIRMWQPQNRYEVQVNELAREALNAAYETNDDSLISEIAWTYGIVCYQDERTEPAAMYLLFAAELDEKIGRVPNTDKCLWLGATLYKTRDYRNAIYYTLASVQQETDHSMQGKRLILSRYNTVGVCYQRMGITTLRFIITIRRWIWRINSTILFGKRLFPEI
jgi:hypothetical protein